MPCSLHIVLSSAPKTDRKGPHRPEQYAFANNNPIGSEIRMGQEQPREAGIQSGTGFGSKLKANELKGVFKVRASVELGVGSPKLV